MGGDANHLVLDEQNPYPGLYPFQEVDRKYFFGRDRERDELLRLVERGIVTVLFGGSGLGKSSLLNAGLFPSLRKTGYLPVPIRFTFPSGNVPLVEQLKSAIRHEIKAREIDAEEPESGETLWEYFHRVHFWDSRNRLVTPVIVADQFEEIFTVGRGDPGLPALIQELADLIENRVPSVVRGRIEKKEVAEIPFDYERSGAKVIFSLREDFLGPLEDLRRRIPSLGHNRYRLSALSGEQAFVAVQGPGAYAELISDEVAGQVVRFVAGTEDGEHPGIAEVPQLEALEVEPALLSLMCRELNRRRQVPGLTAITEDLLRGTGSQILDEFYRDSIADLGRPVREFIEDYLLTASGYRNTMSLDNALQQPGVTEDAIDKLISRRLLRHEERLNIAHVELIHDVLTETVKKSRDQRREEESRRRHERELADRQQAQLRKLRIRFLWVGGAAGLLLLLLLYRNEHQNLQIAEALQKAALGNLEISEALQKAAEAAVEIRVDNPEGGLRLARDAFLKTKPPLPEAVDTVGQALHASHLRLAIRHPSADDNPVPVRAVAFSPDGSLLASADSSGNVTVRNALDGQELFILPHPQEVRDIDFDKDGTRLATACSDRAIRIWDLNSKAVIVQKPTGQESPLEAIEFSPDDQMIATSSQDGSVKVWSVLASEPEPGLALISEIRGSEAESEFVLDIAFSPDGSKIAMAGVSKKVIIRDLDFRGEPKVLKGHTDKVNAVAFSPDGARIASASLDETVRIWEIETESMVMTLRGHDHQVWDVAFNDDGSVVASGGEDRKVRLWDSETGVELFRPLGHHGIVYDLDFAPDGQSLASASKDGRVRVWRTAPQHREAVRGVAFDQKGERLVTVGRDKTVRLWSVDTGKQIGSFRGHGEPYQVALSPDGVLLATADWDNKARIWDVNSGQLRHELSEGHTDKLLDVAFSRSGQWVVTGSYDGKAIVWDVDTGGPVYELHHSDHEGETLKNQNYIHGVAFDPTNDYQVATASWDGYARTWVLSKDGTNARELKKFDVSSRVNAVAYSPDGRQLATVDVDKRIKIWDIETGEVIAELSGHTQPIYELAFSQDGARLASGGVDGKAVVWDLGKMKEMRAWSHFGEVNDVAFSPDGKWLATACTDKRWYVYPIETEDLLRVANGRLEAIDAHFSGRR